MSAPRRGFLAVTAAFLCGCSTSIAGSSFAPHAALRVRPADRQTGAQWTVYQKPALENLFALTTAGTSIIGASPANNRFALFKTVNGSATDLSPGASAPYSVADPIATVTGKDGKVYFVALRGSSVLGRFSPSAPSSFEYCALPAAPAGGLSQDPVSGTFYVSDRSGYVDVVAWGTASCSVTLRVPDPVSGGDPYGVAAGQSGQFFVGDVTGHVLHFDGTTLVKDYDLQEGAQPQPCVTAIVYDPVHQIVWFDDNYHEQIGEITSSGVLVEYPEPLLAQTNTQSMAIGPDGNVWAVGGYDSSYVSYGGSEIYDVAPTGKVTTLSVPSPGPDTYLTGITIGPDRQPYISDVNEDTVYVYNYYWLQASPAKVTLARGASTVVKVSEQHYRGALTAKSSNGKVAVKIRRKGSRWLIELTWRAKGKASVRVTDAYGNYVSLSVTTE